MKTIHKNRRSERGIALLIAIFALLLISGVALSLVMMSGTETAISANYRVTTQAFYSSYAGLEEVRTRLWPNYPTTSGGTIATAFYAPGAVGSAVPINNVFYIINPAVGEVVAPTNLVATNAYADTEYQREFGVAVTSAVVKPIVNSNATVAGLPGPNYKWVRITPKTERSSGIDVNGDGTLNNVLAIYSDGTNQFVGNPAPGNNAYQQVFRITSLAVPPGGGRRILQYDAMRVLFNITVPSALTFDGAGAALFPANSAVYTVDGNDNVPSGPDVPPGGCPAPGAAVPAVGVVSNADDTSITNSIPNNRLTKCTGSGATPDVENIYPSLPPTMLTINSLEAMIAGISQNANYNVTGPVSSLPDYGSASNPVVTVVNGDLSLSGNITGYGILVVTGNFDAAGTVGWRGIVMIIGQGHMAVSGGGNNSYEGAVFLARTRDAAGNLLPGPAPSGSLLDWNGGGGNGVHYSTCQIQNANNANAIYRVLSFREVPE